MGRPPDERAGLNTPVRPLSESGLELLGEVLSLSADPVRLAPTRLRLFAGGLDPALRTAAALRLVPALADALRRKGLVPPVPAVAAAIEAAWADHRDHWQRFEVRLSETVGALNRLGIEPLLIKGSAAIWTGAPTWRSMRDLDLVVPSRTQAQAAHAALLGLGYGPLDDARERPRHHHLTPLFHREMFGFLEIHIAAGNHYAERLLPTAELVAGATAVDRPGGRVSVLGPVARILHGMIHHHAGHGASAHGTMDVKGLYEFAWDVAALDGRGRGDLLARAARHPRLLAMLDLWLAAAAALFGLEVAEPLAVHGDARARWQAIRRTLDSGARGSQVAGYAAEIGMASRAARLRRLDGRPGVLGRQRQRLRVLASILPRGLW